MAGTDTADTETLRSAAVRDSARGWHQIQLAVLGFVGLCGVLQRGQPDSPIWLQTIAGLLIIAALATALVAVFIVGRVAWPPAGVSARPARQLRTGILLTFVAVGMVALGTTSMWWPDSGDTGEQVRIQTADGRAWCGRLAAARDGTVGVQTQEGAVIVALGDVAVLQPVDSCG
jgi:hypothetical protein